MTMIQNKNSITPNTIYCIGRNYVAHIAELNNERPTEPLVFLKPNSSLTPSHILTLPSFSQSVHYETELVLLIGQDADSLTPKQALDTVSAYAVGLDLTARDVQNICKEKGLPWTKAKGFKNGACISDFIGKEYLPNANNINFSMKLNGTLQQKGNTHCMIYSIPKILCFLAETYGLRKGDLIFTGTPEGVGVLKNGDVLELDLNGLVQARFEVVA